MAYESDLDPDQLAIMTWFKPEGAKRSKKLAITAELERDFRHWLDSECRDHDLKVHKFVFSNGQPNYRLQCTKCGFHEGAWIAKTKIRDLDSVPEGSSNAYDDYYDGRRRAWSVVQSDHFAQQDSQNALEYQEYLNSSEWRDKREKVLKRANGTCEGCLDRAATEVHHITYEHIGEEFLWELRAVCQQCHDRIHQSEEEQ
ncbi:HNH endonuclease [Erythrobacter sp. SCSIO 43205]|uniref:HNH endonuclease n=1 Tax=Erythrobacter sp. SCSIO 43205 TaxID=2779361 RepID=UPI001CA9AC25|nr:HNH endonuclease signature motif containing protein [Erythrobacter sp. SCSIO 43205]UAB78651.1 HNH endonuclease [Erythrobacter sp. SCSIO 43205]